MHLSLIPPLFLLGLTVCAEDANIRSVKLAFDTAHIPNDLSINFNPTAILEVTFPEAGKDLFIVRVGEHVLQDLTAGPPTFTLKESKDKGPFVIAVVDPDAPTPQNPTLAQFRHFLGGNFTPSPSGLLKNSTPALTEFKQPSPPAGSDPHRYIFLVFRQPDGFNQQRIVTSADLASKFNISAFASEVGLGDPVAGTFMLVGPNT